MKKISLAFSPLNHAAPGLVLLVLIFSCSTPAYYQFKSHSPYAYAQDNQGKPQEIQTAPIFHEGTGEEQPLALLSTWKSEDAAIPNIVQTPHKERGKKTELAISSPINHVISESTGVPPKQGQEKNTYGKLGYLSGLIAMGILAISIVTHTFLVGLYLLFCVSAIVLSAIGLKKRQGKKWAELGLALGIFGLLLAFVIHLTTKG